MLWGAHFLVEASEPSNTNCQVTDAVRQLDAPAKHRDASTAQHTGAVVFVPAPKPVMPDGLTLNTVEADPHITVLYLGRVDPSDHSKLVEAVRCVMGSMEPGEDLTTGRLTTFSPAPDGTPVVLEYTNAGRLKALHERLVRRLAHLTRARQHHDYRPHLTLGYAPELSISERSALATLDHVVPVVPLTEVVVRSEGVVLARVPWS